MRKAKFAIRNSQSEILPGFPVTLSAGSTPVPIPNTEVKPAGADGTARATAWESRKSPGLFKKARESITFPRAFRFYYRQAGFISDLLAQPPLFLDSIHLRAKQSSIPLCLLAS